MSVWPPVDALEYRVAELPPGRLSGTAKVAGAPDSPVRRRVQIVAAVSNAHGHVFPSASAVATWTWADEDGNWEVRNLDPSLKYHAIAYDHTGVHDPVIKLNLVPTVNP